MAEYIDREEFLKRIKPYDTPDKTDKALYNFALNKMIGTPTADVVEREKVKQAREEIDKLASHKVRPISFDQAVAIDMCIGILDKLIESEG